MVKTNLHMSNIYLTSAQKIGLLVANFIPPTIGRNSC